MLKQRSEALVPGVLQSLLTGVAFVGVLLHQVDDKIFSYNCRKEGTSC